MATVTQFWAPQQDQDDLFQAVGTTATWTWALGDNSHYWSFAVRPKDGNEEVEVTRQWATSDNDLNLVQSMEVTTRQPQGREFRPGGSLTSLMFTAIKVEA